MDVPSVEQKKRIILNRPPPEVKIEDDDDESTSTADTLHNRLLNADDEEEINRSDFMNGLTVPDIDHLSEASSHEIVEDVQNNIILNSVAEYTYLHEFIRKKQNEGLITFSSKRIGSDFTPNYIKPKSKLDKYGYSLSVSPLCIPDLLSKIEAIRIRKLPFQWKELQNDPSGFMFDFDIKQPRLIKQSQLNPNIKSTLCRKLLNILSKYLDLSAVKKVHTIVMQKPGLKDEEKYMKDGLHILVPSIQTSRKVKKFIMGKIEEAKILEGLLAANEALVYDAKESIFDKNCAHVPVNLYGGAKDDNPLSVYDITEILESDVEDGMIMPPIQTQFSPGVNMIHELSLISECKIIKKVAVAIKKDFENEIASVELTDFNLENKKEMFSIYVKKNPDFLYVKGLLDLLKKERYDNYAEWNQVMFILYNMSPDYKILAEYFSRKSAKFNSADFEKHWQQISLKSSGNHQFNNGALYNLAKEDDPSGVSALRSKSVNNIISEHTRKRNGKFEDADISDIVRILIKDLYITKSTTATQHAWYEFVLEEKDAWQGEVFKWRQLKYPHQIFKLIQQNLYDVMVGQLQMMKNSDTTSKIDLTLYNKDEIKAIKSIQKKVITNLEKSVANLRRGKFTKDVISNLAQYVVNDNIDNMLDKRPDALGVRNGILLFRKYGSVEFVHGYNELFVSKYTKAKYIPFDPENPITKRLLLGLRGLFPNNHSDSFEFLMHFLATSLQGGVKLALFIILYGNGRNGKTVLMELMKETFGLYGGKMDSDYLSMKTQRTNAESAKPMTMQLAEKRFVYFDELNKGDVIDGAKVKGNTGGGSQIARGLHEAPKEFINQANQCLIVNDLPEVYDTTYGFWRRAMVISLLFQFMNQNDPDYNPEENPHQKLEDPFLDTKNIAGNIEILSAFLSILIYFNVSLQVNYGGNLTKIPHPHIEYATKKYQYEQDIFSQFVDTQCVKLEEEPDALQSCDAILELFKKWLSSKHRNTKGELRTEIVEKSKIGKFLVDTECGRCLKGHRFLSVGEDPQPNQTRAFSRGAKYKETDTNLRSQVKAVQSESPEEFYERVVATHKQLFAKAKEMDDKL